MSRAQTLSRLAQGLVYDGTSNLTVGSITVGRGAGNVSTNTAVGAGALDANTTGASNTGLGYQALLANTDGTQNTAVGRAALTANTSGILNSAFGRSALLGNTTGGYNTAIGGSALASNTTASNNTAVGYQAGYANTTGTSNLFAGRVSGYSNSTGSYNTFLGDGAGYLVTTGSYNTAVGWNSLDNQTMTGNYNVMLGSQAGYNFTTGSASVGVGHASLYANSTGQYNVAVGMQALQANTTASYNTAVGYQAGYSNTTGAGNTFLGNQAGYAVTTSNGQTFIGSGAGSAKTTGGNNTFVGASAGASATTGTGNTFVGVNDSTNGAGYAITTGSKNTIIGGYTGNQGGLDIRTSSNYIVLSDGDGYPRVVSTSNNLSFSGNNFYLRAINGITTPSIRGGYNGGNNQDYTTISSGAVDTGGPSYPASYISFETGTFTSMLERVRISNTGVLDLASGAGAVGQIQFPATQVASSNANTLDDYEEGSFTPTLGASISDPSVTYVSAFTYGRYIKIGRLVYFTLEVRTSSLSGGSGNIRIRGLPFAKQSDLNEPTFVVSLYNVAFDTATLIDAEFVSDAQLYFRVSVSGTVSNELPIGNWANTNPTLCRISGSYYASA